MAHSFRSFRFTESLCWYTLWRGAAPILTRMETPMKTRYQIASVTIILLIALGPAALGQTTQPIDYVDPHIGGISYLLKSEPPTVQLPFGMMRLAPMTSPGISDSYLAEKIYGFPVDGALLMPTTGSVETDPAKNASRYDHDFETATPYYYAVMLEKNQHARGVHCNGACRLLSRSVSEDGRASYSGSRAWGWHAECRPCPLGAFRV